MEKVTLYAVPFFIALLAGEAIWTARRRLRGYETKDTFTSLAMGTGNVVVDLFWKSTALALFSFLHRFRLLDIGTGPGAWIVLLFLEDFIYYWLHRYHHEIRFLWASHIAHHSSRRYNLSTALRQSWTTPFTFMLFYWVLPVIGFDPLMALAAHSVNRIYQYWIHTELIGDLGWFEKIFNTPSHHRVHHGKNVEYLDANYGGILIVWDRLFGSFVPEQAPVRYGLTKDIDFHNPIRVAFHEWRAMFRDAMKPNPLRIRLAYLFQPPGWSPDGSTQTAAQMKAIIQSRAASSPLLCERPSAAR